MRLDDVYAYIWILQYCLNIEDFHFIEVVNIINTFLIYSTNINSSSFSIALFGLVRHMHTV